MVDFITGLLIALREMFKTKKTIKTKKIKSSPKQAKSKAKKQIIKKHESLFVDEVQNLIDKINIFGYHFASLDIRQDSSIHDKVFHKILTLIFDRKTSDNYSGMSDDEKINFISKLNFTKGNYGKKKIVELFKVEMSNSYNIHRTRINFQKNNK